MYKYLIINTATVILLKIDHAHTHANQS